MNDSSNYDDFVKAYNNFDLQPLSGERLEKFYVDDFTKESVQEIITTISISEHFKKLLVIGHRGCGKSTILNKVAEDLKNNYHVVSFSAADVMNMMDVKTVDILLGTYLQVLNSIKKENELGVTVEHFEKLMKPIKERLSLKETGISLLGIISFKFMVETESRYTIRDELQNQMEGLQKNLSDVCQKIRNRYNKDVLIIIDDLDKLETKFAEQIFFDNPHLLSSLPEAKIIYTFPLDTYYCDAYIRISDRYDDQFIPLVNLLDSQQNYLESSQEKLRKLILRRIDKNLIDDDALKYLIDMSGGLLRDLVKFMQDCCKLAIVEKMSVINYSIAKMAVNEHINQYYRIFDFPEYSEKVREVALTKKKIDNKTLIYLLRYLFVLEYRYRQNIWYDVHPCLKDALERKAS